MKISVITPFYNGQEYMKAYLEAMLVNKDHLQREGHELEIILVNDSPEVTLVPKDYCEYIEDVVVVVNEKNSGIHFSRLKGLEVATGDYVIFLDQDDLLTGDALLCYADALEKKASDVLVANAFLEQSDGHSELWYRTPYHKSLISDFETYLKVGIQIISPGHTIIKKSVIPSFWKEHIMSLNGADDYFLWLLMLSSGIQFDYLDLPLYIHKYTGTNLSADTTVTDESIFEFLEYLGDFESFKQEDIFTLHSMISYKNQFRNSNIIGKMGCSLANLSIFLTNLKYKRKTKTAYGFNRE